MYLTQFHSCFLEVSSFTFFLQPSPSIVDFKGHFTFRNHLCLTFELLSINLYELIKSDQFKGYHPKRIQSYANQLMACLSILRRENIIHCDLKPENILLDLRSKLSIKVIDFGSSCFGNEKSTRSWSWLSFIISALNHPLSSSSLHIHPEPILSLS